MKTLAAFLMLSGLFTVGMGIFNKPKRVRLFTAGGFAFMCGWSVVEWWV